MAGGGFFFASYEHEMILTRHLGGAGQGCAFRYGPPRTSQGHRTRVCRATVVVVIAVMSTAAVWPALAEQRTEHNDGYYPSDGAIDELQQIRDRQAELERELRELHERLQAKEVSRLWPGL